jgi:hypothetical protein
LIVPYRLLSIALPLSAILLAATARAACPDEKPEKIKVTLVVILASEEGNTIDPRLKAIAAEVQKQNPNFKSFQLKTMTCKSLQPGEQASFPCINDKSAKVTVKAAADRSNKVSLAIVPPDQGEIIYRTVCGKFLPIVTRCKTKSKERLILAVRVQPCVGE